ncbi:MAG: hypothetical protein NC131_13570 [Roseburia sp.]|nr:hypothetical protein [Roseburia sp.]
MISLRGTTYDDQELDACGSTTQAILDINNIKIPLCSSCVEELLESIEEFKNTTFCYQCKNWIRAKYGNDGSCKKKLEERDISIKSEDEAGNVCWTAWMDTCKDAERKEENNGD